MFRDLAEGSWLDQHQGSWETYPNGEEWKYQGPTSDLSWGLTAPGSGPSEGLATSWHLFVLLSEQANSLLHQFHVFRPGGTTGD